MSGLESPLAAALRGLEVARDRFADLAVTIRENGPYANAGFLQASAERMTEHIAIVHDLVEAEIQIARNKMKREMARLDPATDRKPR